VDDDKRYDVSAAVKGKEADLAAVAEGDSGDDSGDWDLYHRLQG